MKRVFALTFLLYISMIGSFAAASHASTLSVLEDSIQQQVQTPTHREEIQKALHLGPNAIWEYISLAFAFTILVEILSSPRRGANLGDLFSRFLIACILGLSIYHIIGFIEGSMKSMAQSIEGSTSYWALVAQQAKVLSQMDWQEKAKHVYFFFTNPLVTALNIFNFLSYCFVMIMLELIRIVQETVLSVLHAVAPIVVALYLIPELNILPSYILLFFSISSWSFFAAVIGKIMAARAADSLMLISVKHLLVSSISNFVGGFSVWAAAGFAVAVFHSGGSLGTVLGGVMSWAVNGAQVIASRAVGAAMGGFLGLSAAQAGGAAGTGGSGSGKTVASATGVSSRRPVSQPPPTGAASSGGKGREGPSEEEGKTIRRLNTLHGALSGAMLGPSRIANIVEDPTGTMKSFIRPQTSSPNNPLPLPSGMAKIVPKRLRKKT